VERKLRRARGQRELQHRYLGVNRGAYTFFHGESRYTRSPTRTLEEALRDPSLHDLPYKIEINAWGKLEMSPASTVTVACRWRSRGADAPVADGS